MGNGIAHVFAQNGFQVTLIDVSEDRLQGALKTIEKNLERIWKYCQRDVMVTAQVFLKLNGFQQIEKQNIIYV